MRLALVEALTFARRLARRRLVAIVFALDAAALAWIALASPPGSVRAAFGAAQGLGALTSLVLASGCVADDRGAGRLVLGATHPDFFDRFAARDRRLEEFRIVEPTPN